MKCTECRHADYCSLREEEPNLTGCTSGQAYPEKCPFCGGKTDLWFHDHPMYGWKAILYCPNDACKALIESPWSKSKASAVGTIWRMTS